MATPNSRENLKQYCLRMLGKPVVEINVDDDQLEDRIDEGLQYFQEYHFDGVEKTYVRHKVTGSTVTISNLSGEFASKEIFTGGTSNASATQTIGTSVSKTVIGTQINVTATTVNTLFGSNSQLRTTLTVTGLDSGARITIPVTITKQSLTTS